MKAVLSLFSAINILLAVLGSLAYAQPSAKVPRVGYVALRNTPTSNIPDPAAGAFREGLRELGYVEGKNIVVEYRYAEGKSEGIPGLVDELVQLKIDVLVSPNSDSIRIAKQVTKTIPIVMVTTRDPVEAGFVDSLAHPGGNVTGLTRLTRELSGKRLELLKEVVPKLSVVGLIRNMDGPGVITSFKEYETAARTLKIQLQSLEVRGPAP